MLKWIIGSCVTSLNYAAPDWFEKVPTENNAGQGPSGSICIKKFSFTESLLTLCFMLKKLLHFRSYWENYKCSLGNSLHFNLSKTKMYITLSCADFWLPEVFFLPTKILSSLIFTNHYFVSFLSTQDCIIGSPVIVIAMHNPKYVGLLLRFQ